MNSVNLHKEDGKFLGKMDFARVPVIGDWIVFSYYRLEVVNVTFYSSGGIDIFCKEV